LLKKNGVKIYESKTQVLFWKYTFSYLSYVENVCHLLIQGSSIASHYRITFRFMLL